MYTENGRVSHRQLFRQMAVSLLGIYLLYLPGKNGLYGRFGIFCIFLPVLFFLIYGIYLIRIKNCYHHPEKYFGKVGGKLFLGVHLCYLFLTGIFLLLVIERMASQFFIEGNYGAVLIILTALVSYMGCGRSAQSRGRMAEVIFPTVASVLGMMLFGAVWKVHPGYLQMQSIFSYEEFVSGSLNLAVAFLPFFFFPFALGNTEKAGSTWKVLKDVLLLIFIVWIVIMLLLQGTFGIKGISHKAYPVIDLMAGVSLPGDFLKRVDILWSAAILFCLLFALGSIIFYEKELLFRAGAQGFSPYLAVLMTALALFLHKSDISLSWYEMCMKYVAAPLLLFLSLIAGISIKKKRKVPAAVLVFLLMISLTGCGGVEPQHRTYPLVLGVDIRSAAEEFEILYGIPDLSKVTGQGKEDASGKEEGTVDIYTGKTLKKTEEKFMKSQENYLDMGHIKVLLVGKRLLAKEEKLTELLDYLETDPSVAGNIYVFSCENLKEAVEASGKDIGSLGDYLAGMMENRPYGEKEKQPKLQDFYNAWHNGETWPQVKQLVFENGLIFLR